MAIARKQAELVLHGVFTRPDAVAEFQARHKRGEHVLFVGPTGRGKTTFASSLLMKPATERALVMSVKGRDPALAQLGKRVGAWPMPHGRSVALRIRQQWNDDKPPYIYRWEPEFNSSRDLVLAARMVNNTLEWLWQSRGWTLYLPDLQIIADRGMMGLGKPVEAHLLTARSRDDSLWLDAQAPRWIPRAAADQVSHLFVFKNRDIDVVRRLREIAGLDMYTVQWIMSQLAWHEILWVDVRRDEYFIIECPCKECKHAA